MTNSLARSLALSDQLGTDEALEINQAILELDPANELAATAARHRPPRTPAASRSAIAVLEAAVRAHPENTVADKRLQQAQRDIATAAVPKPRRRPKARIAREVWVKAMEYKDGWTTKPGQLTWVSDAGIIDHNGRRKIRDNGQPWGEPSWRVGDQVGLYLDDTNTIPVLAEIAARPVFDPAFVAAQSGSAEDGERWPWVTEVRVITTLPPESRAHARGPADPRQQHAAAHPQAARTRPRARLPARAAYGRT